MTVQPPSHQALTFRLEWKHLSLQLEVDSFEECLFIVEFLHRVTRTSCAVMYVATEAQENVLKLHGIMLCKQNCHVPYA